MTTVRLAVLLAYSTGVLLISHTTLDNRGQQVQESPHSRSPVQRDLAAEVLRNAVAFDAPQVGSAGITPTEVLAWRVVMQMQGRDSVLRSLLETSTPAGQLYALAGLRYSLYVVGRDSSIYWAASTRLSQNRRLVPTMVGCFGSDRPLNELVKEIDTGWWTAEFLAGHLMGGH